MNAQQTTPTMRRSLWRKLRRCGIYLLALPCAYLLLALILGNIIINRDAATSGDYPIYLISNGVHTDIVMPLVSDVIDWRDIVSPQDSLSQAENPLIAIGWGERNFYLNTPTWADLTLSNAIKALSGINSSLMHVSFYQAEHLPLMHDVVPLSINREQYQKLSQNIIQQFVLKNGRAQVIAKAHTHPFDAFYLAQGRYHLFRTCNTWLNQQLKHSGIRSVFWTPFAHQLLAAYR